MLLSIEAAAVTLATGELGLVSGVVSECDASNARAFCTAGCAARAWFARTSEDGGAGSRTTAVAVKGQAVADGDSCARNPSGKTDHCHAGRATVSNGSASRLASARLQTR